MFATRIKELRKKRGLTQMQFASQFKISNATIAMYETGKRQPDNEMLVKIAEYFNVSIDYLIGYEGSNYKDEVLYTDDELALIQTYRLLSRDSQLQLIGYMRALAQMQGVSYVTMPEESSVNLKK